MLLYVISLLVGLSGMAVLYYAFSRSLDRNSDRRNKQPISYLAPVFLSISLVLFTLEFAAPRLRDLVPLLSDNMQVQEISLEPREIGWMTVEIDSKPYYFNRFQFKPLPWRSYRMTALPNSRHILWLEQIADNTNDGGQQ